MIEAGIPFRLTLPHKGFHRAIGNFAGHYISPDGDVLTGGSVEEAPSRVAAGRDPTTPTCSP